MMLITGLAVYLGCMCMTVHALIINETYTYDSLKSNSSDKLLLKHETLPTCKLLEIYERGYEIYPNKTVFISTLNITIEEPFYELFGDHLKICQPSEDRNFTASTQADSLGRRGFLYYLSLLGNILSILFLSIHLLIYFVVTYEYNLPGSNLASLSFTLLLCYLIMITDYIISIDKNTMSCAAIAATKQFLLLASSLWMLVLILDIFLSIRNATKYLTPNNEFKLKKYFYNCLIGWGIALVITVTTVVTDIVDGIAELYKPQFSETCWFKSEFPFWLFFAGPGFLVTCFNFALFGMTACILFSNKMKFDENDSSNQKRKYCLIYLRLAVITGVSWLIGAVVFFVQAHWLYDVWSLLYNFHGFFIFVSFTCRTENMKKFKYSLLDVFEQVRSLL